MPVPRGSRVIDVDFKQAVPTGQSLGMLQESPNDMFSRAPAESYGNFLPLIPRSEWKARADKINPKLRKCIRNVKNQRNEGSCVGNGGTGQWQFAACLQFGADEDYRILSAAIAYSMIGSSANSGAYVGDVVTLLSETGCIVESGHGYLDKYQFGPTGFYDAKNYRKANPDWVKDAANYLSGEYYRVDTVDEWATALLSGHPILKGRSGHCIFDFIWDYDEAAKWFAGYCNSWGDWGDPINEFVGNGLGWDSERSIDSQSGYALVGVKLRKEIEDRIETPTTSA